MKKAAILLIVLLSICLAESASAWNDSVTHPHITELAVPLSIIDEVAKQQLNLPKGIDESIGGKTILEWLRYGAEQERRVTRKGC